MPASHDYALTIRWTGNLGPGTTDYRSYSRDHEVRAAGKPLLLGSADPNFRGDPARWSPEELLVAALSQCHLLWYLHLAAVAGVVVTGYVDEPVGTMQIDADGGGQFTRVLLRPTVTVAAEAMVQRAARVHHDANAKCFIARSMNFPVEHEATTVVG